MIVKVKTLTGKEISVELKESDLVYHIKELLEEKEGIPPSQQRLIFQGKQIADAKRWVLRSSPNVFVFFFKSEDYPRIVKLFCPYIEFEED
ncbi:hypothetical protein SEUBUCD646_0B02640 [Saccharomyces eubayanus]|uniref:Ubiquitin-like domain-containing protein n=1 Tax=Saccharomyces eubayanus TaxID=1080349 RepID=A0ABN8VM21_SACEU|nr:RUB1-like protein [Saccharomyces eubayanus]KOH00985.1 RUB1-like protein [Saccharomyces eubayanus]CAI1826691.1 hypothetical protein SEUBUCD650_0B02650 [Saccharomyces eubayanus]CAI1861403.1 hypothetical protein SEUBUCD646_0B02640 [Saccharomyces eubayanus]